MKGQQLLQLEVENFRSINEKVTVRLDAPVVLIHGHNGAGKTSLLSAIELALTGGVSSLARVDPTYQSQLLHYGAARGELTLQLERTGEKPLESHVVLEKAGPMCSGTLEPRTAQFFSERCYLAQSALSLSAVGLGFRVAANEVCK
jgi:DNA repair protein SbcC/Rad50